MTETQSHTPIPLVLEDEGFRGVVYGDPGVGKSTLLSSFPRPLIVDTDAGLISVALHGTVLERFEPTGYKDLEDLYVFVKNNSDRYDTIGIDSFTELQRLLLDEIVDDGAKRDEAKGKLNSITRFVPEQGEYLANQRQLHRILHAFRRLGKHVVLTAGVRMRGMQRTPDMAPGALTIVNHWASFIGEIVTHAADAESPLERYIVFEPTAERMAKSRFSGFGRFMRLPAPGEEQSGYDVLHAGLKASFSVEAAAAYDAVHVPPTKKNLAAVPDKGGST